MAENITLMIIRRSGCKVHRISVSGSLVICMGVLMFIVVSASAGFLFSYARIKQSGPYIHSISATMNECRHEAEAQQRQIDAFREGVAALNANIMALMDYEGRIRDVANIQRSSDDDGLFGVGGVRNETDDPSNELSADSPNETPAFAAPNWNPSKLIAAASDEDASTPLAGRNVLSSVPVIMPLKAEIASAFGEGPVDEHGFRRGILLASRESCDVVSTADGIVSYVGRGGPYGLLMVIDHGHGFSTRYGLLDHALKSVGETVSRGEAIARTPDPDQTDQTASAYYEVRLNGICVNPLRYVIN